MKMFKDYPEAKEQMKKHQKKIEKKKLVKNYEELCNIYVDGRNKLLQEYESARKIPEDKRRLMVIKDLS